VTPSLKVYLQLVQDTIKSPEVICFIRHLLNHIPGRILLFWDGNSPHKSKLTQTTLADLAPRLTVYRLPAYAPELNPDEGLWAFLKSHALRGYCPPDANALIAKVRQEVRKVRARPGLIRSFFKDCRLFF
jgi:transposase